MLESPHINAKELSEIARIAFREIAFLMRHYAQEARNVLLDRTLSAGTTRALLAAIREGRECAEAGAGPRIYYEMLQEISVIENFDPRRLEDINRIISGRLALQRDVKTVARKPRLIFAGEGSSREIPGNLAVSLAKTLKLEGVEVAVSSPAGISDLNWDDVVIVMSNSGETSTSVELAERAAREGILAVGMTTNPRSRLARACGHKIILECGEEKAVGATKSVVEQSLAVAGIIYGLKGEQFPDAQELARKFKGALTREIPLSAIRKISRARQLVVVGRNGLQKELNLKIAETIGMPVKPIETCDILHGDEETFSQADCILIFEPPVERLAKIEKFIAARASVIYITAIPLDLEGSQSEQIIMEDAGEMQALIALAMGQNLLIRTAVYKGSKCEPRFARKVGDGC